MKLHELAPVQGARKERKRLGRGTGSGLGKTSGKGHKGQNARSGGGVRLGFEGGQMPLIRRLPKHGFTNNFKKEYSIINVCELSGFPADTVITGELLVECGIIRKLAPYGLKVLGDGGIDTKIVVHANKFSASAKEAIEKAGGQAIQL